MTVILDCLIEIIKPKTMTKDGFNINLNQNLWLLLISITALGASEYYCLPVTKIFAIIISILSSTSMLCTLTAYTINYVRDKLCKNSSNKKES